MSLLKWIIVGIILMLIVLSLPYILGRFNENEAKLHTYFQKSTKNCDICLDSFKIPCNMSMSINDCVGGFIDANSACAKNCTLNFMS
jgi:hypothetical protein